MKWVLIWFIMTSTGGITSGSVNFESEAMCESAEVGIKVALVLDSTTSHARCFPVGG